MAIKRTQREKKKKTGKAPSKISEKPGRPDKSPARDEKGNSRRKLSELKKKAIAASKKAVVEEVGPDRLAIEAVALYEDLDHNINLFATRLREWYSVHFPEAARILKDNREFTEFVEKCGERKTMTSKKLVSAGLSDKKIESIEKAKEGSIGIEITKQDLKEIQKLASTILAIEDERDSVLDYLGKKMNEVAPNINSLVGETVGAKLLARAGSLRKLAMMPASTIQVIGAEKALFRHLKNKSIRPPKHGIIYQFPQIRSAPANERGKIARALAGKLAIAAREDYFGNKKVDKNLKKDFEKRLTEIHH